MNSPFHIRDLKVFLLWQYFCTEQEIPIHSIDIHVIIYSDGNENHLYFSFPLIFHVMFIDSVQTVNF